MEDIGQQVYIGRKIKDSWYDSFVDRATSLMPSEFTFIPETNPGLRYVSQSAISEVYGSEYAGDELLTHLTERVWQLADSSGSRTMNNNFTTVINNFRFTKNGSVFWLTAKALDLLRTDGRWRLGEEWMSTQRHFLPGKETDCGGAPQHQGFLLLGKVTCDGELPHFSVVKSAVQGKLLDNRDPRPTFRRVAAVEC